MDSSACGPVWWGTVLMLDRVACRKTSRAPSAFSVLFESMFARSTVDPYLLHSSVPTAKVIGMFLADAGAIAFRFQRQGVHEAILDLTIQHMLQRSCFNVYMTSCFLPSHKNEIPSSTVNHFTQQFTDTSLA